MHPRPILAAGLGLGAVAVLAAPAAAHVTATPSEVAAGAYTAVTLTVGHGCDGSPTTALTVEVPDGIDDVTPGIVPGWTVEVATEPLAEPVTDTHGDRRTERERTVTYTATPGNELPDGFRQSFTIGYRAPETPGEHLFFKTIQTCAEGETAWIAEYTGDGEEPDSPSPVVLVTEATGDGHGHGDEGTTDDEHGDDGDDGDDDAAEAEAEAGADNGDGDGSRGIAVAGLVAGALGLVAGGAALARSGRRPST